MSDARGSHLFQTCSQVRSSFGACVFTHCVPLRSAVHNLPVQTWTQIFCTQCEQGKHKCSLLADAAAQRRALLLPSVAVTVTRNKTASAIPTMERRDRSSLGRLVMPDAAAAEAGGPGSRGKSTVVQEAHANASIQTEGAAEAGEKFAIARHLTANGKAALRQPAARSQHSKSNLGVRATNVKRSSHSHKAQLAMKRRRIDYNVKLVLSEPVGTK